MRETLPERYFYNKKEAVRIDTLLKNIISRKNGGRKNNKINEIWQTVVNEDVQRCTRVMGLREGILYVQAESAAVIHYLTSFGKSDTIKKINVLMEKEYITDIRFKTGMVDERKRYTR